ncbi:NAD(P)H-dependent FMN reductase [Flexibacter flexilis DSM 6793]|uniref:NAD(P)H-dependent FMN reductase n=1 Tax=Flexibacter flexilis DSM 6793 TaxID=927664 RepID=A0A1I1G3A0_9BACT|nr:NAD(P)H-dependent oxidoreductase [Flexibacter flexilis]SFC06064.1 NAD(P)H-dependent FMN reductase [Flexibacter flexilis DSM 6793]
MKIAIISGSPRLESTTFRVALHLKDYFSATYPQHEFVLVDVREYPLPYVQNVFSSLAETPPQWKGLGEIMFGADAFVLISPEYNGSYSPALKNLLDHFPKQLHKTFAVVTASPGMLGGMRAAQQLLLLVSAFFGVPSPHLLVTPAVDKKFSPTGALLDESFAKTIQYFAKEFVWLAEALADKK